MQGTEETIKGSVGITGEREYAICLPFILIHSYEGFVLLKDAP